MKRKASVGQLSHLGDECITVKSKIKVSNFLWPKIIINKVSFLCVFYGTSSLARGIFAVRLLHMSKSLIDPA